MLTLIGMLPPVYWSYGMALTAVVWASTVVSCIRHFRKLRLPRLVEEELIMASTCVGDLARVACIRNNEIASSARTRLKHILQSGLPEQSYKLDRKEYKAIDHLLKSSDICLIEAILSCVPLLWNESMSGPLRQLSANPAMFPETLSLRETARNAQERLRLS